MAILRAFEPERSSMVRMPAHAGTFYPSDPAILKRRVERFIAEADDPSHPGILRAIVAPHAGYDYSGPVAGSAYRAVAPHVDGFRRALVLGPSHRVYFRGVALPASDGFRTPLGDLPVDADLKSAVADLEGVAESEEAHRSEHSVEVQLPFLQVALGSPSILPVVVGDAPAGMLAGFILAALEACPDTLVVASSDLSHYLPYATAKEQDQNTAKRIQALEPDISPEEACGCHPVGGLLEVARRSGWRVDCLDLRNSGDTEGDPDRVVGYGAFAVRNKP